MYILTNCSPTVTFFQCACTYSQENPLHCSRARLLKQPERSAQGISLMSSERPQLYSKTAPICARLGQQIEAARSLIFSSWTLNPIDSRSMATNLAGPHVCCRGSGVLKTSQRWRETDGQLTCGAEIPVP